MKKKQKRRRKMVRGQNTSSTTSENVEEIIFARLESLEEDENFFNQTEGWEKPINKEEHTQLCLARKCKIRAYERNVLVEIVKLYDKRLEKYTSQLKKMKFLRKIISRQKMENLIEIASNWDEEYAKRKNFNWGLRKAESLDYLRRWKDNQKNLNATNAVDSLGESLERALDILFETDDEREENDLLPSQDKSSSKQSQRREIATSPKSTASPTKERDDSLLKFNNIFNDVGTESLSFSQCTPIETICSNIVEKPVDKRREFCNQSEGIELVPVDHSYNEFNDRLSFGITSTQQTP